MPGRKSESWTFTAQQSLPLTQWSGLESLALSCAWCWSCTRHNASSREGTSQHLPASKSSCDPLAPLLALQPLTKRHHGVACSRAARVPVTPQRCVSRNVRRLSVRCVRAVLRAYAGVCACVFRGGGCTGRCFVGVLRVGGWAGSLSRSQRVPRPRSSLHRAWRRFGLNLGVEALNAASGSEHGRPTGRRTSLC